MVTLFDSNYKSLDEKSAYVIDRSEDTTCDNCSSKMKYYYRYKYPKFFTLCELCNNTYRYSPQRLKSGIICKSDLSQSDIIISTFNFLKKNKRIPRILEIDPDAKLLNFSFVRLIDIVPELKQEEKELFSGYKLFSSDMIKYDAFPFTSMFWKHSKYPDYKYFDVIKNETPKIDITPEQQKIIEKYDSF